MMSVSFFSLLSLGFSLGLLHALDADHVMAMTTLNNSRPGLLRMLTFCLRWALGHGGILLFSAALLFGLGVKLSPLLQYTAEIGVGVLLIGLGLWCFWCFHYDQDRPTLVEHHHGNIVHSHWCKQEQNTHDTHQHQKDMQAHTPVLVGILHGLAGSAPALALLPSVIQGNFLLAITYLLVFSLGVMLAMLGFGLGWGATQKLLQQRYKKLFEWNRRFLAVVSIAVGMYWVHQAV